MENDELTTEQICTGQNRTEQDREIGTCCGSPASARTSPTATAAIAMAAAIAAATASSLDLLEARVLAQQVLDVVYVQRKPAHADREALHVAVVGLLVGEVGLVERGVDSGAHEDDFQSGVFAQQTTGEEADQVPVHGALVHLS